MKKRNAANTVRRGLGLGVAMALSAVLLMAGTGCKGATEFRAASGSSLETGLNAIADGLLNGLFAVYAPDSTTSGA